MRTAQVGRDRLRGKRILVTGASGGIGRPLVAALRERGALVLGTDLTAEDGVIAGDVRDEAAVQAAVAEAADRLGGLDVLVNNAGIGDAQDAGAMPGAGAAAIVDVNLFGAWRMTAAALPHLLESRGRVVNVASALAFVNIPFAPAYGASKRGLAAYSDVLRLEYGTRIGVTTVYPGYIKTPIHDTEDGPKLDGLAPEEPVDAAVRAIVRACERGGRDVATTPGARVGMFLGRHAPRLMDRAVSGQVRRAWLRSREDLPALAAALRDRMRAA